MIKVIGMITMRVLLFVGLTAALTGAALAQSQQIVLGQPQIQIGADQKILFEAATKMVQRDFKAAEALYGQAIAINNKNIEAYLQRSMTRRELGDDAGMTSDAQTVVTLADAVLQQDPQNAHLHYQRGMGYRLLKQFEAAKNDVTTGMQLSGNSSWQTDLQAIDLERRETAR